MGEEHGSGMHAVTGVSRGLDPQRAFAGQDETIPGVALRNVAGNPFCPR
jgi:hypothetical protein